MLLLASRLWFWAAVVRPLKHIVPLRTLVHLLHQSPRRLPNARRVHQELETFLRQTGRLPRRPPANCLERSLGAYRLLCRAGAAPAIVVGMRRGGTRTGVDGHVWVVVDGRPLAEDDTFLAGFGRVLAFDASGRQTSGVTERMPEGMRLGS
jgi:Transglutaminase-like superfamily